MSCLAWAAAQAQNPAPTPQGRPDQQIERIRHEDAGSRIDELRVGGEARQIIVQPKGSVPAYEVAPEGSNRNPAGTDRNSGAEGRPGWKLFNF